MCDIQNAVQYTEHRRWGKCTPPFEVVTGFRDLAGYDYDPVTDRFLIALGNIDRAEDTKFIVVVNWFEQLGQQFQEGR